MKEHIEINTEYIKLGQFLKLINVFESGGMIKNFLQDEGVLVNDHIEHRRGRKLYEHDVVQIIDVGTYIIKKDAN